MDFFLPMEISVTFVCNGPIALWLIAFGNQIDHLHRQTVFAFQITFHCPILKTFLV